MANNRLWLVHKESGESFYLGKRMGWGWYGSPSEAMDTWLTGLNTYSLQDDFVLGMEDPEIAPEGTLEMHPNGEILEDADGEYVVVTQAGPKEKEAIKRLEQAIAHRTSTGLGREANAPKKIKSRNNS